MVRTWRFHCHGPGSIPGWGTKIPQATGHGQKKKKENGVASVKIQCMSSSDNNVLLRLGVIMLTIAR